MITTKLSNEVLEILKSVEIKGFTVKLNCGRLERKLYQDVNEALAALGGSWNRKSQGHDFESDPKEKLQYAIETGEVIPPSKNGYFATPKTVVKKLLELAKLGIGMTVLEPSAGQGAIAEELRALNLDVTCCEILPDNIKILKEKGFAIEQEDFFNFKLEPRFDRVVMNPPFELQADIDHIYHAYGTLKPSGLLVSVMGAGVSFREDKKAQEFRKFVEVNKGQIIALPDLSFKESGTNVRSLIVVIPKGEDIYCPVTMASTSSVSVKKVGVLTLDGFFGIKKPEKLVSIEQAEAKVRVEMKHSLKRNGVAFEPETSTESLTELWNQIEASEEEGRKIMRDLKKTLVDSGLLDVASKIERLI